MTHMLKFCKIIQWLMRCFFPRGTNHIINKMWQHIYHANGQKPIVLLCESLKWCSRCSNCIHERTNLIRNYVGYTDISTKSFTVLSLQWSFKGLDDRERQKSGGGGKKKEIYSTSAHFMEKNKMVQAPTPTLFWIFKKFLRSKSNMSNKGRKQTHRNSTCWECK